MQEKKSRIPAFIRIPLRNFIRCGLAGWCMEILFTAMGSLRRRNMRLTGTTSLLMFPIYGSISFLKPLFGLLRKLPLPARGFTYMSMIFSAEFLSGRFLRRRDICPWDYSKSPYNIGKVIRLDYAPCWFCMGLLFEKLLFHRHGKDETAKIPSRSATAP